MSKTKEEVEDIILYEIYKNLNIECDSRKEWLKKLLNRRYGKDPSPDTVDTMISKADDEIGAGGITGAMAGFVVAIVRKFHKKGEEFYLARKDNYKKIKEMEANNIGKLNQD